MTDGENHEKIVRSESQLPRIKIMGMGYEDGEVLYYIQIPAREEKMYYGVRRAELEAKYPIELLTFLEEKLIGKGDNT